MGATPIPKIVRPPALAGRSKHSAKPLLHLRRLLAGLVPDARPTHPRAKGQGIMLRGIFQWAVRLTSDPGSPSFPGSSDFPRVCPLCL